jgi:cation transport regulator ChaB
LEGEGHVGSTPSIPKEDHIEQLMDVPKAPSTPTIAAPYPTSTRQLRSYVVHAPKKMSREHVAYITHQLPETEDQVYKRYFAMSQAAFNSVSGYEDGSDAPKNYKEVLQHKNQARWWASMNKKFHATETKGAWEVVLMSSMPAGRKVVGNRWVLTEKDVGP